jgi:glycosyltransferase involved in cell wall biosynthesis
MLSGGYILIISNTWVGEQMAGPGIRYFHLARVLSQEFPVILAAPGHHKEDRLIEGASLEVASCSIEQPEMLKPYIQQARAILAPALMVPWLLQIDTMLPPLIVDGYAPWAIEALFLPGIEEKELQKNLTKAYLAGDFFICASERQRDWWLGILSALGRVNSHNLREDPSLRRLVDVVPFGLPAERPQTYQPVIKGIWPGISKDDKIILWGGGLWRWMDPFTAIRAMERVYHSRQDVRLLFLGIRSTRLEGFPTLEEEAIRMAQESGLLGQAVFFGEWVPYADWPGVLLESDVAITLHPDTLEARLAFRSRVLDYIWAGIPVVATRGDVTAELVEKYGLGKLVDYEDEVSVAEAILELLERPRETLVDRFECARRELTWEKAAQPLIEFCRAPHYAADRMKGEVGNPFYRDQIEQLRNLLEEYQNLVRGYERGRFIRFMKWLKETFRIGK